MGNYLGYGYETTTNIPTAPEILKSPSCSKDPYKGVPEWAKMEYIASSIKKRGSEYLHR
jgi:hypothetical protein